MRMILQEALMGSRCKKRITTTRLNGVHIALLSIDKSSLQIPYIQQAAELTNGTLKLLASAWSPPAWAKTIENLTAANSFLKDEYYQLWADYYLKFFEAYAENNVTFWALTTQNEPRTGYIGAINSLAWTVEQLVGGV